MESICRLCLQDGPDLTSVFAEMVSITGPPLEEDAEKLIRLYLPIQVSKHLRPYYVKTIVICYWTYELLKPLPFKYSARNAENFLLQ